MILGAITPAARLAADRLHAMGLPVAIAYAEPEA